MLRLPPPSLGNEALEKQRPHYLHSEIPMLHQGNRIRAEMAGEVPDFCSPKCQPLQKELYSVWMIPLRMELGERHLIMPLCHPQLSFHIHSITPDLSFATFVILHTRENRRAIL